MGKVEAWARNHKGLIGLLAAVAAGLGVLVFLLHPKGQQVAQSALGSIPTGGSSSGGSDTGSSTNGTAASTSSSPFSFLRPRNVPGESAAATGYDAGPAVGLPIFRWVNGQMVDVSESLPYGGQIQLTGNPVLAAVNGTQGLFEQIAGSDFWVNVADIVNPDLSTIGTMPAPPPPAALVNPPPAPTPTPTGRTVTVPLPGGAMNPINTWPSSGPAVQLKTTQTNVPRSSVVMGGVG